MFSQKKPYSAVTVAIERLSSETYQEDDLSGIPDLVEVIKLQPTGPAEAARAIRKKLKYGSPHRQLRALTLLDGLIQNAGPRFQRTFADEPLLERLRFCAASELVDPDVRRKCVVLFRGWSVEYRDTVGLERVCRLYREVPKRKALVTQERSRAVRESENPFGDEDDGDADGDGEEREAAEKAQADAKASSMRRPSRAGAASVAFSNPAAAAFASPPSSSMTPTSHGRQKSLSSLGNLLHGGGSKEDKKKDKSKKTSKSRKAFNLEAEKEAMKATIAESSLAATDLTNALQSINREKERVGENSIAVARFENCKLLRRKVLRYIHHVESEQWLGGLLHANDELVVALMTFEQLDRSIDADSDSDDEIAEQAHMYRMMTEKGKSTTSEDSHTLPNLAGMSISPPKAAPVRPSAPPRPSALSKPRTVPALAPATVTTRDRDDSESEEDDDDDDDEDDPFGDRNALATPKVESKEPDWT